MFRLVIAMAALVAAGFCPAATGAFTLPPGVKATASETQGGWQSRGTISLAFAQAKARLATSIAAAGWSHVHSIALGKGRTLDTWRRGGEELTVMVWRVSVAASGFSYGVSAVPRPTARTKSRRRP